MQEPENVLLSMRLAIPDLDQEGQIHQSGIGLINLLGIDFFEVLNQNLETTDGVDWLTKMPRRWLPNQPTNQNVQGCIGRSMYS